MRQHLRRYLFSLLGALTLLCAAAAGVSWAVDPYRIFHTTVEGEPIEGIGPFTRITKPYMARNIAPRVLLAGSSRAEYALVPAEAERLLGEGPAFNAALSGPNIYEVRRMIDHANGVGNVRTLVLGLDFYMFNAQLAPQDAFSDTRLAVTPQGARNHLGWLSDLPLALLSIDTLEAVRKALKYRGRGDPCQDIWYRDGTRLPGLLECEAATNRGFRDSTASTLKFYLTSKTLYKDYRLSPGGLAHIQHVLEEAAARGQRVVLYFSPVQALHLGAIDKAGLWPLFEAWKKEVFHLAEETREEGADIALWDFARLSPLTAVTLPPENEEPWQGAFYDSHHVRPEIGKRMMAEMLTVGEEGPEAGGARLTVSNLDKELARQRSAFLAWWQAHEEARAFLDAALPEAAQ